MVITKDAATLTRYIGRTIGAVTITSLIGRGAMGAVFHGFQRTLKRSVAIKILPKDQAGALATCEQFRIEAQLVGNLSHPSIVTIHEMGEEADCLFMIMQLINGEDLNKKLNRKRLHPSPNRRLLPFRETIAIIGKILRGLEHAHQKKVVHQDVKPSNILIDNQSGEPYLSDFGIARAIHFGSLREGFIAGSPLYIAPELLAYKPGGPQSDIYSTGIMLYKMLAGDLPLATHDPMKLLCLKSSAPGTLFIRAPSDYASAIDPVLESVIVRAIAPDPENRYRSCSEFIDDLDSYARLRL